MSKRQRIKHKEATSLSDHTGSKSYESNPKPDIAVHEGLKAQRDYVQNHPSGSADYIIAEAFIRGMRNVGYKSTASALGDLSDNAIEAGADKVLVLVDPPQSAKPNAPQRMAIVDNGHGMDPLMIETAVKWGGTHRENSRSGYGRFGYGLPSASVAIGRRFTVFSKPNDGDWHFVMVDTDNIVEKGKVKVPKAIKGEIPLWISRQIESEYGYLDSGTIVLIETLDQLTWNRRRDLVRNLIEYYGRTYRDALRYVSIKVDGKEVDPVDPLFLTEAARLYDLDEDRAMALPSLNFSVKSKSGEEGYVKVRMAYFPHTFHKKDKQSSSSSRNNMNERWAVMTAHQGLIVSRNGRQIDVLPKNDWTTFINNDRHWGIEIDFDPVLDEEFSVTTSKQQVVLSERLWDILEKKGLYRAIKELRARTRDLKHQHKEEIAKKGEKGVLPSEKAMIKIDEMVRPGANRSRSSDTPDNEKTRVREHARSRAKMEKRSFEEVFREELQIRKEIPYQIATDSDPEKPFFWVEREGNVLVLVINRAHPFYTHVYDGASKAQRAGLQLLLFVLAHAEDDARPDVAKMYKLERRFWSERLGLTLESLMSSESIEDLDAQDAEMEEMESMEKED